MSKKLLNSLAVYVIGITGGVLFGLYILGGSSVVYPIVIIAIGLIFVFTNNNTK